MNKLFYSASILALAGLSACSGNKQEAASQGGDYTLTVAVTDPAAEGHMMYLTDYDTDLRVDSAIITGGKATITGKVDAPFMGRLMLDGRRAGMMVIEPGTITVDSNRVATGTPVNDAYVAYWEAQYRLAAQLDTLKSNKEEMPDSVFTTRMDSVRQASTILEQEYKAANEGNPRGMYMFITEQVYDMSLAQLDSALKANPTYANSARVQSLRQGKVTKEQTSEGHKFVDFAVPAADGDTARLSDHVGRGHYTLVDFWASWCGPCIRETETIKRIHAAYPDSTLEVLGVAVWDEPENTLKAIEQHKLPWAQIINTQKIATDAYGIPAIPCIILFDPEGMIVSRDKYGAELEAAVAEALAPKAE